MAKNILVVEDDKNVAQLYPYMSHLMVSTIKRQNINILNTKADNYYKVDVLLDIS